MLIAFWGFIVKKLYFDWNAFSPGGKNSFSLNLLLFSEPLKVESGYSKFVCVCVIVCCQAVLHSWTLVIPYCSLILIIIMHCDCLYPLQKCKKLAQCTNQYDCKMSVLSAYEERVMASICLGLRHNPWIWLKSNFVGILGMSHYLVSYFFEPSIIIVEPLYPNIIRI